MATTFVFVHISQISIYFNLYSVCVTRYQLVMKNSWCCETLQRHEKLSTHKKKYAYVWESKEFMRYFKKLNDLEHCIVSVIYAYYFVFKLEFSCILNKIYCIWYITHSSSQPRVLISFSAAFVSYQIGRSKRKINLFNCVCDANNVFLLYTHTHCVVGVVLWCVWLFACKLNAAACINLHSKESIKTSRIILLKLKILIFSFLRINLVSLFPGFYFSQRGYSVWLGNARGNIFIIQISQNLSILFMIRKKTNSFQAIHFHEITPNSIRMESNSGNLVSMKLHWKIYRQWLIIF